MMTGRRTGAVAVAVILIGLLQNALVNGQTYCGVRLRGETSTSRGMMGIVEACFNERFFRLCRNSRITSSIATSICNELFYANGRLVPPSASSPMGPPFVEVDELECTPGTPDFRGCELEGIMMNRCQSQQTTVVECFNDFLPFLVTNYYDPTIRQVRHGEEVISDIDTSPEIPYGNETFRRISVHENGVLAFGGRLRPEFPRSFPADKDRYVLAPFWTDSASNVSIDVEVYRADGMETSQNYLRIVSNYVQQRTRQNFTATLLVLSQWIDDSSRFEYQVVIITNGNQTYAIYTYECQNNPPRDPALIGTSAPGRVNQFRYSNFMTTSSLGCSNGRETTFYNLMYLLDQGSNNDGMQNSSSSNGSCIRAGFGNRSCCQPFTDPTDNCRVGSGGDACYCDGLCFERRDCCNDIHMVDNIRACVPTCREEETDAFFVRGMREGYPRICRNGIRRYVCNEGWDEDDAEAVCQQMGFATGESEPLPPLPPGRIYPAGITNVSCDGAESTLIDCLHENATTNFCMPNAFATIECEGQAVCRNGEVRIVDGAPSQGTVELCVSGTWRRVCASEWDTDEATVICRQLSLNMTATATTTRLNSSTTVFVDARGCLGNEMRFSQCLLYVGETSCTAVAGVICGDPVLLTPSATPTEPNPPERNIIPIVVPAATVGGLLVLALCLVVVIVPWIALVKLRRKQKQDVNVLQELAYIRSEDNGQQCNDYVRNKLFQGNKGPNIKPEYVPLLSSEFIVFNQQLRLLDSIGQGEFGIVYKAHFFGSSDGDMTIVAVKTLKGTFNDDDVNELIKECLDMRQFQHPNVMSLLGVCLDAGPAPYLVLPFMANGNLLSYLKQRRPTLLITKEAGEEEITTVQVKLLSMCLQIAKGMEYLASQKFVHRDLAARNCMIDEAGVIKVADFGLAKSTYEKLYFRQDKSDSVKLPIKWMAIESIDDGVFSEKTDVWAFGITCWEIFSVGKVPYGGVAPLSLAKVLRDGERMEPPDNAACSEEIYLMVMKDCWEQDPDKRPTFSQLQTKISSTVTAMAGYMEFSEFASVDSIDSDGAGDRDAKAESD